MAKLPAKVRIEPDEEAAGAVAAGDVAGRDQKLAQGQRWLIVVDRVDQQIGVGVARSRR